MEVFSVFATLSLVDLISSPLTKIQGAMRGTETGVSSLSRTMGTLTMAMAPVAVAAGLTVGALALCTRQAMDFESAMADVAKVVNFNGPEEFQAMSAQVKELSGRIPMAAEGIAAIIAAAGQSGVAKLDLAEFAEQAAKMGVAFDLSGDQAGKMMADWRAGMALSLPQTYALADAVNHLSNNMNATAPALGEVIQRVGAAAMSCGLAETQVASLGAAFLSAGASPEIAATALKKFTTTLVKGAAMSDVQAAAFQSLGFSATQMAKDMQTDAQGTIFKVLNALAGTPKELQMSLLTQMFGEEAIGAIAPLLKNMGLLDQAFTLTGDAANYAGSMQAEFEARSKTAQNALQLLTNKLNNLAISIGTAFLPTVSWAAEKLGSFVDAIRAVVDTPLGQWLLQVVGGFASALLALTALSGALWFASSAWPMLVKALAPLKAALLGLSWPVLTVIAAVGLLYVAYKNNFGGMADTLNRWWRNISLVVRGVVELFKNLTGSTGEIRGELATEIKAAGLENLVVNVGRAVYRIKEFFAGIAESLNFDGAIKALTPAMKLVSDLFTSLGAAIGGIFGTEIKGASSEARGLGQVLGGVLSWVIEGLATVFTHLVRTVDTVVSVFRYFYALLTGDWATATAMSQRMWDNFCASLMAFADLFRIGDWIRSAWADAQAFIDSIDLYESGKALLQTFADGIAAAAMAPVNAVSNALSSVRDYLPFSDAKTGPLSTLTLSGSRMMTTLAEGVVAGAGSLLQSVTGALGSVGEGLSSWWSEIFGDAAGPAQTGPTPNIPAPETLAENARADAARSPSSERGQTTITIHIASISLPGVTDGQNFVGALQGELAGYGVLS